MHGMARSSLAAHYSLPKSSLANVELIQPLLTVKLCIDIHAITYVLILGGSPTMLLSVSRLSVPQRKCGEGSCPGMDGSINQVGEMAIPRDST